ncbi:hypothetical protein [Paraburkholderia megapolitana]|uniref:hypothetical protein n=1 Tax=Paraburkholderia megapolitana TaxID=420953 RepID=UPI0038BCB8AA
MDDRSGEVLAVMWGYLALAKALDCNGVLPVSELVKHLETGYGYGVATRQIAQTTEVDSLIEALRQIGDALHKAGSA